MTNPHLPLKGCFVTGTDTGVGKTRISAALLRVFAQAGLRTAGLKPVAAGLEMVDGHLVNDDVQALQSAASVALAGHEVGPVQLPEPCAPHIAAALAGRRIERPVLLAAARHLATRADMLVVEGVGGFIVPLSQPGADADFDTADLAVDLGLPVVLVVGLRLGCLSHALLTAEAVRARGLHLAGWVGNHLAEPMPHAQANLDTLAHCMSQRYGAPCLGVTPYLPQADADALATHLNAARLRAVLHPNIESEPALTRNVV
ncbi:MAG: dethiobiotin synthase [Burkholderiales bacterium]